MVIIDSNICQEKNWIMFHYLLIYYINLRPSYLEIIQNYVIVKLHKWVMWSCLITSIEYFLDYLYLSSKCMSQLLTLSRWIVVHLHFKCTNHSSLTSITIEVSFTLLTFYLKSLHILKFRIMSSISYKSEPCDLV